MPPKKKGQVGSRRGLAQEVLRAHCRLLYFNLKNSTGRSPIFVWRFPFKNAPFRSQVHPVRTLKVQYGGAPQGLAQEVLRTHCRLVCFQL